MLLSSTTQQKLVHSPKVHVGPCVGIATSADPSVGAGPSVGADLSFGAGPSVGAKLGLLVIAGSGLEVGAASDSCIGAGLGLCVSAELLLVQDLILMWGLDLVPRLVQSRGLRLVIVLFCHQHKKKKKKVVAISLVNAHGKKIVFFS